MKHFCHRPQEHLTDTRLVPLENRRAALPRYYESEASKPPQSALYLKTKQGSLWLKFGYNGMWLVGTSVVFVLDYWLMDYLVKKLSRCFDAYIGILLTN